MSRRLRSDVQRTLLTMQATSATIGTASDANKAMVVANDILQYRHSRTRLLLLSPSQRTL